MTTAQQKIDDRRKAAMPHFLEGLDNNEVAEALGNKWPANVLGADRRALRELGQLPIATPLELRLCRALARLGGKVEDPDGRATPKFNEAANLGYTSTGGLTMAVNQMGHLIDRVMGVKRTYALTLNKEGWALAQDIREQQLTASEPRAIAPAHDWEMSPVIPGDEPTPEALGLIEDEPEPEALGGGEADERGFEAGAAMEAPEPEWDQDADAYYPTAEVNYPSGPWALLESPAIHDAVAHLINSVAEVIVIRYGVPQGSMNVVVHPTQIERAPKPEAPTEPSPIVDRPPRPIQQNSAAPKDDKEALERMVAELRSNLAKATAEATAQRAKATSYEGQLTALQNRQSASRKGRAVARAAQGKHPVLTTSQLLAVVRDNDWKLEKAGSGHWKAWPPESAVPVVISSTAGGSAVRDDQAKLRAAGLPV